MLIKVVVPALEGRKGTVRFGLFSPARDGETPKLYSEGTGLFIMPKEWADKYFGKH